ncbi:hypothetical protein MMC12_007407 [Toensbergia leucococca]|nr:hypothetical protein [Toensbergia leucococca]
MECAGRGLAFWSYQSTQEIVYQEYLAKTWADKYNTLSVQMDKIINDANSEIDMLNQKLSVIQVDQDKLKNDNTNLVAAFREKSRKHQQTQELYDRLKRKEMTAATQSAAFDSVDEVLGSVASSRQGNLGTSHYPHNHAYQSDSRAQGQRDFPQFPLDHNGVEQLHTHQRSGNNGSGGSGGMMAPPPPRRAAGFVNAAFGSLINDTGTPSHHRTRLGQTTTQPGNRAEPRNQNISLVGSLQSQTPSQRQPLGSVNTNSVNRSGVSGYGMSAGMKVGRQQALRPESFSHPGQGAGRSRNFTQGVLQPQQIFQNGASYYLP